MALEKEEKWLGLVVILLIIFAVILLVRLAHRDPGPDKRTRTRIVANTNLPAFTLLTKDNLRFVVGSENPPVTSAERWIDQLKDRYLMMPVKKDDEVKSDMVAPEDANTTLRDAVAVGIPATPSATLGGQLRVGDLVEVIAVPCKSDSSQTVKSDTPLPATSLQKRFENLLVLNIPARKEPKPDEKAGDVGAMTLAVPSESRDRFAAAVACENYLVARKIPVKKSEDQKVQDHSVTAGIKNSP